ncbi:MAG: SDR family NAD(P)-dependent oxidoreductase [Pseudomonadota bacterium]
MSELDGKVALITGGTRGIGLACASRLAAAGAKVVITGRSEEAGATAAETLGSNGLFLKQDVGSETDWVAVTAKVQEAFGRLDIVVANAGISNASPMVDMSLEQFRTMHDIHLKGAFLAVKYGAIEMRKHGDGGSIILMSSIMGKISAAGYVHYSSAKTGVRLLAKSAALELGPEGIRVNSVLPGFIRTDMTVAFPEEQIAPIAVPVKRFGNAEEIGDAVLFAATDRSKFMTGADLVLDGGMIAR